MYRSDGASRRNGMEDGSQAGLGAAYWPPGSLGKGPPAEKAREYLGTGVSNNVAEYRGLQEGMRRASRRPQDKEAVFEVDSMLLAKQMRHIWACRHASISPLYEECCELGVKLRRWGCAGPLDTFIENIIRQRIAYRMRLSMSQSAGGQRQAGKEQEEESRKVENTNK